MNLKAVLNLLLAMFCISIMDTVIKMNDMGLKFDMKLGPGSLGVTLHTGQMDGEMAEGASSDLNDALSSTSSDTALVYTMPMGKEIKCGTQFIYLSETQTPAVSDSDAVTQNFIGAKFFAKY